MFIFVINYTLFKNRYLISLNIFYGEKYEDIFHYVK